MATSKQSREQAVFASFAKVADLPVHTFESRPEPEPDILCRPSIGEVLAFELVEILDQSFSHSIDQQLEAKSLCLEYLDALPSDQVAAFCGKYADADISIDFVPGLSKQRRRNLLPSIFSHLNDVPIGFIGIAPNGPYQLTSFVREIVITRGGFLGPTFDAPSFVRMGDPTVPAINAKMTKHYEPKGALVLLAYIDGNPMFPDDVWLAKLDCYLASLGPECQFGHIYVYDCRSEEVRRTWRRDA